MQQNNPYNDFGSSLSDIILSGGNGKNTLESIFNNCSSSSVKSNSVRRRRPLGSSVYLKQRDLLHKFSEQNKGKIKMSNSLFKSEFIDPFKKKLYRGVRQRNSGRWVAEIKLPQNRMRVWLGSYETAESAAFAYDRAANKLGGEYAKLNFPNVQDSSQLGLIGDTQKLKALKISVDSKIQAICQKMRREKAMKKKNKKVDSENESEKVMNTEWQCCSSVSNGGKEVTSSASMCEDGFWKVAGESEFEGCTLDSLPSYDPELIWEILAN